MAEEESAQDWASRLRARPKPAAARAGRHTAEEIKEVLVAHDLDDLPAGHAEVLVLEDRPVSEEGDALVSLQRREQEATERGVAARQRKRQYTPYEDEEEVTTIGAAVRSSRLLQQYDEGDEPAGAQGLTLGELMAKGRMTEPPKPKPTDSGAPKAAESSAAFQLPKRNVRRRVMRTFEDEPTPQSASPATAQATSLLALDDDDLQASLARSRRQNVRTMLPKAAVLLEDDARPEEEEMEGLVFSESTDFISSVGARQTDAAEPRTAQPPEPTIAVPTAKATGHEGSSSPLAFVPDREIPQLEKEPLVRRGVAATLRYLAKIGLRPQLCTESEAPQRRRRPRFADIKLEHYDAEGNLLSAKEAFRELSHRFHGKGPGKGKREKLQRRRLAEQRIAAAGSDASLGITAALRERQRATGEAHIVLAQGKHAAPADANAMAVEDVKKDAVNAGKAKQPVKKGLRIFGMK